MKHLNRLANRDRLSEVFAKASEDRAKHSYFVPTPGDLASVPGASRRMVGWQLLELNAMTVEVNRLRSAAGRHPLHRAEVARVESCACGHSDYSSKYALYCAGLVELEGEPAAP